MKPEAGEAFRQKTVDEVLLAAGYVVGPAASNSTGKDETKQGEAGAASSAPAAASQAAEAAIEEAFWTVFADDVMEHRVWPAAQKGHINAAPKAHVDNPEWWTHGILSLRIRGFTCCIGREARRKQEAAGRLFVNSWQAMILCSPKQAKLSQKKRGRISPCS